MMVVLQDYYKLLEVDPKARPEVIHAAYRALMQEYHPDKGGIELVAKKLTEVKTVLLDPKKREDYDKKREGKESSLEDRIGNYQIVNQIAEGGFGKTFLGRHLVLDEPVCIKIPHENDPLYVEMLLEEAKSIWDLRHYALPVMRDIVREKDRVALVMSYIPGKTLEKIVEKVGPLEPEHVSWIVDRSLNALQYLHHNEVIHGDVKPQNIIVQPTSHQIVLVDFGLAAVRPKKDDVNKGFTPYFASPEQEKGSVLLPASDYYSLGMTMIYALGGEVESKKIPRATPEPLKEFITSLIVRDIAQRQELYASNIAETFAKVRRDSFGRASSGFKKIPGVDDDE